MRSALPDWAKKLQLGVHFAASGALKFCSAVLLLVGAKFETLKATFGDLRNGFLETFFVVAFSKYKYNVTY